MLVLMVTLGKDDLGPRCSPIQKIAYGVSRKCRNSNKGPRLLIFGRRRMIQMQGKRDPSMRKARARTAQGKPTEMNNLRSMMGYKIPAVTQSVNI